MNAARLGAVVAGAVLLAAGCNPNEDTGNGSDDTVREVVEVYIAGEEDVRPFVHDLTEIVESGNQTSSTDAQRTPPTRSVAASERGILIDLTEAIAELQSSPSLPLVWVTWEFPSGVIAWEDRLEEWHFTIACDIPITSVLVEIPTRGPGDALRWTADLQDLDQGADCPPVSLSAGPNGEIAVREFDAITVQSPHRHPPRPG